MITTKNMTHVNKFQTDEFEDNIGRNEAHHTRLSSTKVDEEIISILIRSFIDLWHELMKIMSHIDFIE